MGYLYYPSDEWVRGVREAILVIFFKVVYTVVSFVLNWIWKYYSLVLERRNSLCKFLAQRRKKMAT